MSTPLLYQLPPMCGLPSLSPFCIKVQLAFRLKKIDFETKDTLFPRQNPYNKVPFVVWGEQKLEDSTAIVAAIDERGDGPRLVPAAPAARADADLLEDWADESLYWHGVKAKFADEEGWSRLSRPFSDAFPAYLRPLGPFIGRRQTLEKLAAQGLARRSPELVALEFERHLDSLEARLADREWLAGDTLSIADVAVAAMLGQLHEGLAPMHAGKISRRGALHALIGRVFERAGIPRPK